MLKMNFNINTNLQIGKETLRSAFPFFLFSVNLKNMIFTSLFQFPRSHSEKSDNFELFNQKMTKHGFRMSNYNHSRFLNFGQSFD